MPRPLRHSRTVILVLAALVWVAGATGAAEPQLTHFDLRLTINDQQHAVQGVAEFSYRAAGGPMERLSFLERDLEILKVEAEPQPVRQFRVEKDHLQIEIAGGLAGTASRVRIFYRAQPKAGLIFHRITTETGVPVEQVWQYGEWQYWMPRPPDPDETLTWDFRAEVRPDWQVVSNGELVSGELHDARRLWHWRQSLPARFGGFTFAAGNFESYDQDAGKIRITSYVPAGVTDAATVSRSFGRLPQMLEVFSREFGPYPFRDYRQVILWDYLPQGTEHIGLACLSENKLIDGPSRLDADDYIVAHEFAHSWWAMLVAPKSPAHVWLSEGFAVYFGNQFFEAADGRDEFEYRLRRRLRLYLDEDRRYRRVLVSDEPVPGELDEHIYSKGAYILHMLRRYLGDRQFFAGLRLYARQNANQRADSADLQRAFEQVSRRKLDWYFQQWLYRKGYPVLKVSRKWDATTQRLTIEVLQAQEESVELYRLPVVLEAVTDRGAETHDEVLSQRSESRTYQLKGNLRYVRFDSDNRLLAVVEFPRPAQELLNQLEDAQDAQGRIEAVEALAPVSDNEVTPALLRALQHDTFHGVRSAAAAALGRRYDGVSSLLRALHEERDSRVLQDLIAALEPAAAQAEVTAALRQAATSQPSPYVRARALLALARSRVSGTWDMLISALGENSHRDVLRVAALRGLTAMGDQRAVPEILRYLRSGRTTRFAREAAMDALAELGTGDAGARQELEQARAADFWPGVREAAGRALARSGTPSAQSEEKRQEKR